MASVWVLLTRHITRKEEEEEEFTTNPGEADPRTYMALHVYQPALCPSHKIMDDSGALVQPPKRSPYTPQVVEERLHYSNDATERGKYMNNPHILVRTSLVSQRMSYTLPCPQ